LEALVNHGWMVAIIWLAVYLAWRRPETGSWALAALGLIGTALLLSRWFNGQSPAIWFVFATLTLPPFVAGVLLLVGHGTRFASGS
jgi:ABC-type molybdate transport system permease subunit